VQFVHAQVRELMTGYGHIDVLWLDGGQVRPPQQDIRMGELAALARRLQPGLIMADRTVGGPHENILTPEQRIPDSPLDHPWESCLTMGDGWAYRPNDVYKSTRTLIHLLIDIVAKGGNLLLNVGPSPAGRFDEVPLRRLAEIGDWMQVNAEAIHGTRPVPPYKEGNVCFTRRGATVYGLILAAAGSDQPGASVDLRGLQPPTGAEIRMLGVDRPLAWTQRDGVARVALPPAAELPCRDAWVLRFAV
jgi:alpha-L-fucosidase